MNSEGLCDTEVMMLKVLFNCNNISKYYKCYFIFDQINAALFSIKDFFLKNSNKSELFQTFDELGT